MDFAGSGQADTEDWKATGEAVIALIEPEVTKGLPGPLESENITIGKLH